MSAIESNSWLEVNQHYLSVALAWLRLRLERLASHDYPSVTQKQESLRHSLFGSHLSGPGELRSHTNPASPIDEQIAQLASGMLVAESQDEPPALHILGDRLGLSQFERATLLLCIAMELDTRIGGLCARAQGDASRAFPTFALALTLFDGPSWDIVSPERPLRYWQLVEINQPGGQPLTTSLLRADERIVNYAKGLDYLDDRLASFVVPLRVARENLPHSQEAIVKTIVQHWQSADSTLPLVQLLGPDELSKQLVAYHAAEKLHRHLYCIPIEMLPQQPGDIETLARLWHRESLLLPLALYIDGHDSDVGTSNEGQIQSLHRFLAHSEGVFFLSARESLVRIGRSSMTLDVDKPTSAEQRAAWIGALIECVADEKALSHYASIPALLTGQFNLNLTTIGHITREVLLKKEEKNEENENDEKKVRQMLWDACRMITRPRLDLLAQRLELKAAWGDLILPDEEKTMLLQIANQVSQRSKVYEEWGFASKMNRGLGITALFSGESGTGKTMAAEVIANELNLYLYRIDLSAVVSKYIGETEKNLRRLFDAAEDGGAILFFDEADALFGKRSEVKDSHDRYANIEINYLLQRMEEYRGLAILATNMKSALDTAFMRRLRFIVNFPFPGVNERKSMWQGVFPTDTPHDKLDYDRLARLTLTGGSIHNIALNAAFLAANAGTPVTMPLILMAARTEFHKLERPVNEADFRLATAQGAKAV